MSDEIELSPEEREELTRALGYGTSQVDQKHNVHTFLFNIATAEDTTKIGNIEKDELGIPRHPTRAYKQLSLIAEKIMDNQDLASYWESKSENITATSLSKEGFLPKLAVISRREIADMTKRRKPNRGWFKKREDSSDGGLE
jgi:hypothetical protein